MNKKLFLIIFCLFIAFFSAISFSCASDSVGNETVSTSEIEVVEMPEQQEIIAADSSGSFDELDELVKHSSSTLELNKSYTYTEGNTTPIVIDKDITIDGKTSDGKRNTIDGANLASIFSIEGNHHVVLQNIIFSNANGVNGSAVNSGLGSIVEIINCTFQNNNATHGGAVYIDSSNAILKNLDFTGNYAEKDGAALFVAGDHCNLANSTFTGNIAGDDGPAVCWEGSNGIIYNVTCTNNKGISKNKTDGNTSSTRGGAISLTGGNVTISKSRFVSNSAYMDEGKNSSKVDGGALFITGNDVTVKDVVFESCNATNAGGALYIIGNNANIIHCEFNDCTAKDGAALYVDGKDCKLYNSTFTNNVACDDGVIFWQGNNGVMYNITCVNNKGISSNQSGNKTSSTRGGTICLTGDNVTVAKSRFTLGAAYMDEGKDSSKVDGGALFVTGNGVIINDTMFESCSATNNGGAVYVIGNDTEILTCTFKSNKGLDGGALYIEGDGCKLINSTFTGNIADDDGGAIYWEGNNGVIYNITCNNNKGISKTKPDDVNTSSTRGGTLSIIGNNVTLSKSSFSISRAQIDAGKDASKVDGGALFITGNDVIINETKFYDCAATNNGGAIFIIGNNTQILNCSIDKTQGYIGGAIFIDGRDTIVDYSLFRHNTASGHSAEGELGGSGGAIYVQGDGATISNSDFAYGDAINYGGAISVWGANANITQCVFDNCTTSLYDGGSIFVYGVNATVSLSNFTRSTAKNQFAHGGAIQVSGDNANVLECNFEKCFAFYGGFIHISGANALINSSDFKHSVQYKPTSATRKQYPQEGGAIYVSGPDANIVKSNFTDFTSEQAGGAIYINGPNTIIEDTHFDNCKGTYGGDIYIFGNYAKIYDSTFNSSKATYGGAIYLIAWGALIKDSNVTECSADVDGGAIYVTEGGGTNIVGSNFDGCIAKGNAKDFSDGGGAIYIDGPDTHISASNFTNNEVTSTNARGGTIYIKGIRTIIDESNFDKSHASREGGVIYILGEEAVIDSSTFNNSYSANKGGAISVSGHNATIQGSTFENIYAYNNGGAIYVDGEETDILYSSFYNCTVKGNNGGGAIYIDDIKTTVAYSNFTLCQASVAGAIYIHGVSTSILYCNLDNNTAGSAGAIKVFGNDTIISNSNFTYNNATGSHGGALNIGGSNASVYSCWFDHNYAKGNGGAINWEGGHGDDTILGSTFTNNQCHGTVAGGGAIYWTSGDKNYIPPGGLILNCIFVNNTSFGHHGGAIDWYYARDSTINNCLFINNTANSDGGALYIGDQNGKGSNLMMSNNQFYNNSAGKHGGAIANQMANSWIYNNTFDGNRANASGGTLLMKEGYAVNSTIDHCYIYNSFIDQNYAGNTRYGVGGGAIRINDANITISNSAIINSTANKTDGGAISLGGDSKGSSLINVTIQNARILDGYGGAISWKGAYGTMNNVTIVNSSATLVTNDNAYSINDKSGHGGAIYLSAANCNLNDIKIFESYTNCDNETCTKLNYGGAIYVAGSSNTLTNITIDDSSALSSKMNTKGGAIYWEGSSGTLINATISNTLANGQGGAIYWKGGSPTIENISIEYSQTNITNSTNSADGGAIYLDNVNPNLNNVYIIDAIASRDAGDICGGAIYYKNTNKGTTSMNNVTVIGSRASTGDGDSYGGAIYWMNSQNTHNMYNSSFINNTADKGGALYSIGTTNIWNTSFAGNIALDGGALYVISGDDTLYNASFTNNSAKRGGAIFVDNRQIRIYDSSLEFNTAEQKGGALYYNNVNLNDRNTEIARTNLTNNTAFQGSAIYGNKFKNFYLQDVILLDNQANSKEFIEKAVGYDSETKKNYTSAVFIGFDNLLNAIWQDADAPISCDNVTYWDVAGRTVTSSSPTKSDREANINVTVETFNGRGERINVANLTTDGDGRVYYVFDAKDGETYYFAYTHPTDRYYTYLRDTLSNRSLVNIYVYDPIYYGQNQTVLIYLTDGAWGNLNGTVTVTFNDTNHTKWTIDVVDGIYRVENVSTFPIGHYNATARFEGDLHHTGDTNSAVFTVLPCDDLKITKDVNVTGNYVNVTDVIKYTINVTNLGPSDARGVNVTEILTPYLRFIGSETNNHGYYDVKKSEWYIGDLAVGDLATLTITAEVIHIGPITNTVWVIGEGKDINETNDKASARNLTALAYADLQINKKDNVSKTVRFVNVTDRIEFVISVVNKGPYNATGVYVNETLSSHLKFVSCNATKGEYDNETTWNIGNLTVGEVHNLTIIADVISAGNITNVVIVTGFENDTNLTNNIYQINNITALPIVDLNITKEVNASGFVNVSDLIKFTITVRNFGPCDATNIVVTEKLNDLLRVIRNGISTSSGSYNVNTGLWTIEKLNNGSDATLIIIAKVRGNGTISNVVNVTSKENDTNMSNNNDSIKNITALPVVDLVISKKVNVTTGFVNVTDVIKFTITVHNNGPCDAHNVNVTEVLSPLLKDIKITPSKGTKYDGKVWYIGDLPDQATVTLTIIAEVIGNGTIGNVVAVVSDENDTNKSNNVDKIDNITALPIVDLRIKKEVNTKATEIDVLDYLKFTVTVFNDGPCNATHVYVKEPLSPLLRLIKWEGNGTYVDDYTWNIGNLAKGDNATLILYTQVVYSGNITNAVTVFSYENDTNYTNNDDNITPIRAYAHVDLAINKTVNVTKGSVVYVGDLIEFTVNATNLGPCNSTGVYVAEHLDNHLSLVYYEVTSSVYGKRNDTTYNNPTWNIGYLDKDEVLTLKIVARVTLPGNITNAVVITGFDEDKNLSNNNDSIDNITALAVVDLEIKKEVVASEPVYVDDEIKFIITVHNNGPCDATGVYVVENLRSPLVLSSYTTSDGSKYVGNTWVIGDLANNGTAVLTIIAKVTGLGNITNDVVVIVSENDTNMSNNNDSIENITVLPVADLYINKTVEVTTVNVTDYVTYRINLVNLGPCTATDINVTEHLSPLVRLVKIQTWLGKYDNVTNVWNIPELIPDAPVYLDLTVQVISNGTIENIVTVTAKEKDKNESNNNYTSDNVTALPIVDVKVNKTVNATRVYDGDFVEYTIVVKNDGPCNATGVIVTDKLDSRLEFISIASSRVGITYDNSTGIASVGNLGVNESVILTITVKISGIGEIPNYVHVTSKENDTNPSNNHNSSDNITAIPIVDVKINKTASVHEARIGDNFTYIITVHNYGPSLATDVNVTEKLSDYVELLSSNATRGIYNNAQNNWHIGNLAKGETLTLTLVVKILTNGTIENAVSVTSHENDTNLTNNNYTCENVTALKLDTPIDLDCYDIDYGDDEIITVILPSGVTGTVNITVGDEHRDNIPIDSGRVVLPLLDLAGGNYNVTVAYGGDEKYSSNSTKGKFTVRPLVPVITIEVVDIWVGEVEVLNVTVNAPGTVFVTVNNQTVEIPLENGVVTTGLLAVTKKSYLGNATWNIWGLPVGPYPAFALYPGNENYTSVNTSDLFHVRDIPSTVVVTAEDIHVGEDAVISIKVGPEGVSGNVTVTVGGKSYSVAIDEDGVAELIVPGLKAGKIDVIVEYEGTELYRPSENSTTFNVLKYVPPVEVFSPEITVGEDGIIVVTVPDDATGTITIEIEGKRYTAPIEDGEAIFIIPGLKVGVHDIKVFYSGDDKYLAANTTGSIKVNPIDEPIKPNKTAKVGLQVHETGNPILCILVVLLAIGSTQIRRFRK